MRLVIIRKVGKPSVSILLPVYNGEKFLRESVESVLGQSYGDFELLVWDDASSDSSWRIIQSVDDPRIVARRRPSNLGLFPNLNRALDGCRGELIRLWSQDDRMKPDCLETEWSFWTEHPEVGYFYCATETIDAAGRSLGGAEEDLTPDVVSARLADEISFNWGSMPGNIANVSIPRRTFELVGGFDESFRLAADFEMWVRIQGAGLPAGFCRKPLVELRSHPAQLSRSPRAHLTFVREEEAIRERLDARLPKGLQARRRRLASFLRVLYFHSAVKACAAGDFRFAREMLSELRGRDSLPLLALRWLLTGNLRLYRPAPVYSHPADAGLSARQDGAT